MKILKKEHKEIKYSLNTSYAYVLQTEKFISKSRLLRIMRTRKEDRHGLERMGRHEVEPVVGVNRGLLGTRS